MSLIKILPEYIEHFSLTLHPEIDFVSSSLQPATALTTGSAHLSARPSKCFKNLIDPSQWGENSYDAESSGVPGFNEEDYAAAIDLENISRTAIEAIEAGTGYDLRSSMSDYMEIVNSSSQIARNSKRFNVVRFDPPYLFNLNTAAKSIVRNILMPYYASSYDNCQFVYTNYHTLNFFTSSLVPSDSALIYSNAQRKAGETRPYYPTGSFTIDFYINPRYTNDPGKDFKAGTIMHLSSAFAVSLVSGSGRDGDGNVSGYRILLQLSHSADRRPSRVNLNTKNNTRSYPEDLIFVTADNSLSKNNWHHVSIAWGGKSVSDGTGSIWIDNDHYPFSVPSSSILPPKHVSSEALVLGNYYEGWDNEAKFFNTTAASREGFFPKTAGLTNDPIFFDLDHPLNAEIHDIKIFDRDLNGDEIKQNISSGRSDTKDLLFYVPPFFAKESRERNVLITPFQTERKAPTDPFNVNFSFGVGGRLLNLENFSREFVKGYYPRLYNLTASTLDHTVLDITANGYVYASGSTRKRNLTVLPNDNGRFVPDFDLLTSGSVSTNMSQFTNILGGIDLSVININDMVPDSAALPLLPQEISEAVAGCTPTDLGGIETSVGPVLTIYDRTLDPSSNEVTVFDMSNLFYGNRILPGSLFITDPNVTGSGGKVRISLKDNGRGGLFRADALTTHPTWANVGTVLYNEGVAVIKSPNIPFFGKDEFELKCKGEQNIHMLTVNIPAGVGMFNSSSNPMFKPISASLDPNEYDPDFVYITGLNLHDDNLNVIMRSNLAQPIKKRRSDEFLIKFKKDF